MPIPITQKISPFLWFDTNAEEAARFYTTVFRNSRITGVFRFGDGAPMPRGTVMTVVFELEGQAFTAMNGGPQVKFNQAVSFVVTCDTQAEIDEYWEKLSASGGQPVQCGWVKDRFGLSWQIVPSILPELINGPRGSEVFQALMGMIKLDIAALRAAAA